MADKIVIHEKARDQLKDLARPICFDAAKEIAAASNAQSSWGFYTAVEGDYSAFAYGLVHEADKDNARAQRLLKNINAGRKAL